MANGKKAFDDSNEETNNGVNLKRYHDVTKGEIQGN
jgi:hypothetical protein